jgi:hypothetical protein
MGDLRLYAIVSIVCLIIAIILLIFVYRTYRGLDEELVALHLDLPELNKLLKDNTRTSKISTVALNKISELEERVRKLEEDRK